MKNLLKPTTFIPLVLFMPLAWMMIGKFYQMFWQTLFPCVDKYCNGDSFAPFFLTIFTAIALTFYFLSKATD